MKTPQENLVELIGTALHYAKHEDYKQTNKFLRFALIELDTLQFTWEDIEEVYKRIKEKTNETKESK